MQITVQPGSAGHNCILWRLQLDTFLGLAKRICQHPIRLAYWQDRIAAEPDGVMYRNYWGPALAGDLHRNRRLSNKSATMRTHCGGLNASRLALLDHRRDA